jgi:hypothetical protein
MRERILAIEDRHRVRPRFDLNLANRLHSEFSAAERFRRCRASVEKRCKKRAPHKPCTHLPPPKLRP